jgi:hypothetical protein
MKTLTNLTSIDIDKESGDILVGGLTADNIYALVMVDHDDYETKEVLWVAESGEEIKSIVVQQQHNSDLSFFYETYEINKGTFEIGFSVEFSDFSNDGNHTFDINKFLLLGEHSEPADTIVYLPTDNIIDINNLNSPLVDVDIWANDVNGLKSVKIDTIDSGFDNTNIINNEDICILPVISWENDPIVAYPRIAVADNVGNIDFYILGDNTLSIESSIGKNNIPFWQDGEIKIVGGLNEQLIFVSTSNASITIDTDSKNISNYFENDQGASVVYESPLGEYFAISNSTGKIYKVIGTGAENE